MLADWKYNASLTKIDEAFLSEVFSRFNWLRLSSCWFLYKISGWILWICLRVTICACFQPSWFCPILYFIHHLQSVQFHSTKHKIIWQSVLFTAWKWKLLPKVVEDWKKYWEEFGEVWIWLIKRVPWGVATMCFAVMFLKPQRILFRKLAFTSLGERDFCPLVHVI
jgi:hypothetical protein